MARPTIKALEAQLNTNRQLRESDRVLTQHKVTLIEKLQNQINAMDNHISTLQRNERWLKCVIECLVAPSDDKKAF